MRAAAEMRPMKGTSRMVQGDNASKNGRRQQAREAARQRQEEARRRAQRNRLLVQGGLVLGVLAIAAIVILVIVNVTAGASSTAMTTTGPKNMVTDGIQFTGVGGKATPVTTDAVPARGTPQAVAPTNSDGRAKVVTYIDWTCPACKQFEAGYSSRILSLVAQGKATLEIHPVAILDTHYGTTHYATRAANAAACVANFDPGRFLAVQNEFYANQPEEGSSGLSDSQIKALIAKGGVTSQAVSSCVDHETFRPWVTASTNRVTADSGLVNPSVQGFVTPTIVVDGKLWDEQSDLIGVIERG